MLDKILNFSLTQRFLVIMGVFLLVGVGIVSWNSLTLDAVPDITTNQVVVNTETPGMGPAEVEKLVTFPIETAMGGIPGVEQVRSLSWYGLSQITVTFEDNVDTYFARQLVNERLGTVREQIPRKRSRPAARPGFDGAGRDLPLCRRERHQKPDGVADDTGLGHSPAAAYRSRRRRSQWHGRVRKAVRGAG